MGSSDRRSVKETGKLERKTKKRPGRKVDWLDEWKGMSSWGKEEWDREEGNGIKFASENPFVRLDPLAYPWSVSLLSCLASSRGRARNVGSSAYDVMTVLDIP